MQQLSRGKRSTKTSRRDKSSRASDKKDTSLRRVSATSRLVCPNLYGGMMEISWYWGALTFFRF